MKPILSVDKIRAWDKWTIEQEPISSLDLMERAGTACFNWISNRFSDGTDFLILCGIGNNGGDGLVIGRHLLTIGKNVRIWLSDNPEKASSDFKSNYIRLESMGFNAFEKAGIIPEIFEETIIIDAIFGTGLNRATDGLIEVCIECINNSGIHIVSIDMPSGLMSDVLTPSVWTSVIPEFTLSFQCPRLAFLLEENAGRIGEWILIDIGLDASFDALAKPKYRLQEKSDFVGTIPKRGKFDTKWNFGHALLIAGSDDKVGAALLASEAALKSGPGLLTLCSSQAAAIPLFTRLPEAMFQERSSLGSLDFSRYSAIGIGPGIGTDKSAIQILEQVLNIKDKPLVIDADGINIIARENLLDKLPENCMLTPHVREFERLAGACENTIERLERQREFSLRYKVYVLLKGAYSSLSNPQGEVIFNSSGNPGLAKGGSGDALTGIITALMSRGMTTSLAARLGMMVHGMAADLALPEFGETSMLATDIINKLPEVFKSLEADSPLD